MNRLLQALDAKLRRGDPISPARGDIYPKRDAFVVKVKFGANPRPAAVLIPILLGAREPRILFTERQKELKEHAGQISFPGGRKAPKDKSLIDTALREAEEEIGLSPSRVSVLGALSPYRTSTLYDVTPWVGVINGPFSPVPDPTEVAETFAAPVAFFLEKDSLQTVTREEEGRSRTFYAYTWRGRFIWGATAAILAGLAEALKHYAGEGRA